MKKQPIKSRNRIVPASLRRGGAGRHRQRITRQRENLATRAESLSLAGAQA
jgi:hypothetical protein